MLDAKKFKTLIRDWKSDSAKLREMRSDPIYKANTDHRNCLEAQIMVLELCIGDVEELL